MKEFKPFKHKQVIDLEQMKLFDHVTHGDLSIYKIPEKMMPDDFDDLDDVDWGVLAEGEAHAHAHQLFDNNTLTPAFTLIRNDKIEEVPFTLKKHKDGHMFLKIENEPLLLKHQTHNPFRLYPGYYDIDFQVEEDHISEQIRRVLD